MSDHLIRLGNAWDRPGGDAAGPQRWRRRFGRPGGLAAGDRVLLVVERSERAAAAALNGVSLPAIEPAARWACDVTHLLGERNELVLDLAAEPGAPAEALPGGRGPLPAAAGAVRLEIVCAAAARPRA
jgi:hypothetical protein